MAKATEEVIIHPRKKTLEPQKIMDYDNCNIRDKMEKKEYKYIRT